MSKSSQNKKIYIYQNNVSHISKILNISELINKYFTLFPNLENNLHMVKFGTSGHRGSSLHCTFNEVHVLAIAQAIIQQRNQQGIHGPCYLIKDTHALSEVAFISIIEVLSANAIHTIIDSVNIYTPTPVMANAILNYNKNICSNSLQADGIAVTASHNPPADGGIKYYSCYGGVASTEITNVIEKYSNVFLLNSLRGVQRFTLKKAWQSGYIHAIDFTQEYIAKLNNVINMQFIKQSKLKLGVDPLGGAGINCWYRIAQFYKLNLTFINEIIDPTFRFIHSDYDGTIRIDCTSKLVMCNTLNFCNKFDLIFSNDPDCDRYGIITPMGFMNSNDYLVIAIEYLFHNRPLWNEKLGVGKSIVSSIMIDKIVKKINRCLVEVPIGFKWFVKYLFYGLLGFVGEESAGGTFLNFDASPWSTDKDGIIMCLLAAEISAVTGNILQEFHKKLIQYFDSLSYSRVQIPKSYYSANEKFFNMFISQQNLFDELAGDSVIKKIKIMKNQNRIEIDGIKLITRNGWAVFRESGTEDIYKIYCESFLGNNHRKKIENSIRRKLTKFSNKMF